MSKSYHLKAQSLMNSKSKRGTGQHFKWDGVDSRTNRHELLEKRNKISEYLSGLDATKPDYKH